MDKIEVDRIQLQYNCKLTTTVEINTGDTCYLAADLSIPLDRRPLYIKTAKGIRRSDAPRHTTTYENNQHVLLVDRNIDIMPSRRLGGLVESMEYWSEPCWDMDKFNKLGKEGWELTQKFEIPGYTEFLFRRRLA